MSFVEQLETQYRSRLKAASSADEKDFRTRAWAAYERFGFPDRKTETWKYTGLSEIHSGLWVPAISESQVSVIARDLISYAQADFDIAVMVNGEIKLQESSYSTKTGYEFRGKSETKDAFIQFEDGFASVAAAVARGGFELTVSGPRRFRRPLLIIHCQSGENSWCSTLNRIVLSAGSELQLAEVFLGSASKYLRAQMTEVDLEQGARLDWVRIQEDNQEASHFSDVQMRSEASSHLTLTQLNCGAGWSRSSLKAAISGTGAEVQINGLSFGRNRQHVDQRVEISHHVGQTQSSQLFKGVLKDRARGVLNGKIFIAKDAQKVISSQLNHNLVLSPHAEADTKPELEIYADDVKANHGASIGRLDEDKLFYLMSRGLTSQQAQQMLAQAFVEDVVMKISSRPLRALAQDRVERLLPEFSAQMEHA